MASIVIYIIRNYDRILEEIYKFYMAHIKNKCIIQLEMKVQSLNAYMKSYYVNSYKVLGLLYKLKCMNVKTKSYLEVHAEMELDDREENQYTHLIPILDNFRIGNDIYISTSIKTDNVSNTVRQEVGQKDILVLEYKLIVINIYCYKNNIVYLKKFVEDCEMDYIQFLNRHNTNSSIYITNIIYDGDEKITKFNRYNFSSTKSFSNLFFEGKDLILNRIDNYTNNIEQYNKVGIPHTLGFLFYGAPGCGKTSTIKAIANYTKRTIISINMKHLENINTLIKLFNHDLVQTSKIPLKKRLYVFEEIDCHNSFFSRTIDNEDNCKKEQIKINLTSEDTKSLKLKEKEEQNKISVGSLLEVLDGIIESEDRICIFTTNHIEKIDSAFLRPGRIDVIMEFKKLRKVDIQSLFKLWFNKSIPDKDFNNIKDYSISQAEFGKLCFDNINNPQKIISKLVTFQN
jgi:chaperone BCS1